MLQDIIGRLYEEKPKSDLFHYTTTSSLLGIVKDKSLWASEIKYLNDSQEFRHFSDLLKNKASTHETIHESKEADPGRQLRKWIEDWFVNGAMIFTISFTEKGNVLSQWRGYCEHGSGVSLGFEADAIVDCAEKASFKLGRCIYDWDLQNEIATTVVNRLIDAAVKNGPDTSRHTSQCYYNTFELAATDLIKIAALAKHPSFSEEQEWRCISKPIINYVEEPIEYRHGRTSLIPFIRFPLPIIDNGLVLKKVIVGPSPSPDLAFNGIARFLAKYGARKRQPAIIACRIPYRA